jgi:mycothiol system anti-sigma-R factor
MTETSPGSSPANNPDSTPDATVGSASDPCEGANCTETLRELDLFLDGELSDRARATIHHHLDGCPDCLGAFDFHAELKQVVAVKCQNDEMPPDLLSRIEHCFDTDFDGDGIVG